MARFVNSPNERSLINKHVDSYLAGTKKYSKFVDSTPSFVTYYSRNMKESIENEGFGATREIVGSESGNRYDEIENFPLYNVEEIDPDMMYDGISGITTETDTVAVVLPDTVQPVVDDLVLFQYHETAGGMGGDSKLFRVTEVRLSNVDSNAFYQINLIGTSFSKDLLERQVVNTYELIFDNIGTREKSILIKDDYLTAGRIENLYEDILSAYRDNFFDLRLGGFVYPMDGPSTNIYSRDLHKFLASNEQLLISSKTFMENIKVQDYGDDRRYRDQRPTKYKSHIYNYVYQLETLDKLIGKEEELHDILLTRLDTLDTKIFTLLPQTYVDRGKSVFTDKVDLYNYFREVDILTSPSAKYMGFLDFEAELVAYLNEVGYLYEYNVTSIEEIEELNPGILSELYYTKDDTFVLQFHYFISIKYILARDPEESNLYIEPPKFPTANYSLEQLMYILRGRRDGKELTEIINDEFLQLLEDNLPLLTSPNLPNYYYIPLILFYLYKTITNITA